MDNAPVDAKVYSGYNLSYTEKRGILDLANQTGKRYSCSKCGSEFVVTKGGEGEIICCSEPMTQKS